MNLFRKHLQKAKEVNDPLRVKDNKTLAFEKTDSIGAFPAKFNMMVLTEHCNQTYNFDEVNEIINSQFPECPSDEIFLITLKVNAMHVYVKEGTDQQERWNGIFDNFLSQLMEYDNEIQELVVRNLAMIAFQISDDVDQEELSEKYVYRLSLIENYVNFDNEGFAAILEEVESEFQSQNYENNEQGEENPNNNLDGKFFVTFCALESNDTISVENMNEILSSVLREHDPRSTEVIHDFHMQVLEFIQSNTPLDLAHNSVLAQLENTILELNKEEQQYWHSCFYYTLLSIKHIDEFEQIYSEAVYFLNRIEKKLKLTKPEYIEIMESVATELGLDENGDPITSEGEEEINQEVEFNEEETHNQEPSSTYTCYSCQANNIVPDSWEGFVCHNCDNNNEIVNPENLNNDGNGTYEEHSQGPESSNDKNKKQHAPPANTDVSSQEFQLKCSICGSKDLSFAKKGFSWGKAIAVGMFTVGVGLLAGNIGKGNVIAKCNKCSNQWEPKPQK